MAVGLCGVAVVGCSHPGAAPSIRPAGVVSDEPHELSKNLLIGKIVTKAADTWAVNGIHGNQYTVRITSMTLFGTLFHPVDAGDFKPGEMVRVAGVFSGPTVTATAISHATHNAHAAKAASTH